jgi:hypothetical protein
VFIQIRLIQYREISQLSAPDTASAKQAVSVADKNLTQTTCQYSTITSPRNKTKKKLSRFGVITNTIIANQRARRPKNLASHTKMTPDKNAVGMAPIHASNPSFCTDIIAIRGGAECKKITVASEIAAVKNDPATVNIATIKAMVSQL